LSGSGLAGGQALGDKSRRRTGLTEASPRPA